MNGYRRANKAKRAAERRAYRLRHPDRERAYLLRRRYGITVAEYEALIAGGCAVCGPTSRRLVIDHDHVTGAVRGCLCNHCNVSIGHADDSAKRLRALADYLERR